MMTRFLRALVVGFSTLAIGALALSPSRAADSSTAEAAPADPMSGCCGAQPPVAEEAATNGSMKCGPGTYPSGGKCLNEASACPPGNDRSIVVAPNGESTVTCSSRGAQPLR